MNFAWNGNIVNFIISLVFIVLIYGLLFFCYAKVFRRKTPFIILGVSAFFSLAGFLFDLPAVIIISVGFSVVANLLALMTNLGDLRNFLGNPFSKKDAKNANFGVEKIYDRKAFYKAIEAAVLELSNKKTGAIMTFERNTALSDLIKNGVPINAPVSVPLLLTIFYNGTRLHDGAVVIHGNEIIAAAVFYTPTTETYAVKYGSRHRAAIGISEVSDSVTVVVSEETGRISLAVNGQLETVDQTHFLRVFENYMNEIDEAPND